MPKRLHLTAIGLLLASGGLAGAAPPASAFGRCEDAAYWRSFDPRLIVDTTFGCTELARHRVQTEAGPRTVRVIQPFNAGWAVAPGFPAAARRGVEAFAAALGRLGPSFAMDDVTVLLVDNLSPLSSVDPRSRRPDILGSAIAPGDGECRVPLYALSRTTSDELPLTVAHELFHCVQFATAGSARVLTLSGGAGSGGDWWVEGSAEWFADFAVPGTGILVRRGRDFDAASLRTPLYHFTYPASTFFAWLAQTRGPSAIGPWMRQMASSPNAADQRAALRRAAGEDDWRAFLLSYADQQIRDASGQPVNIPQEGSTWRFEATGEQRIPAAPFVVRAGNVALGCGRWRLSLSPSLPHGLRPFGSRTWTQTPTEIDARTVGAGDLQFAALRVADGDTLTLRAEKLASCSRCGASSQTDPCLMGAWRQSGGGPLEFLRRTLPPELFQRLEANPQELFFRADGTVQTGGGTGAIGASRGGVRFDGQGRYNASGRWSTSGGTLTICPDVLAVRGRVEVEAGGERGSFALPPVPSQPTVSRYSCSADRLTTTVPMGGGGTMSTTFSRVSPPPASP